MTTSDKAAQPLTTEELRRRATAFYLAAETSVAEDIARHLLWAADIIDAQAAKPPAVQVDRDTLARLIYVFQSGGQDPDACCPDPKRHVVEHDGIAQIVSDWHGPLFKMFYPLADAIISALPGLTPAPLVDRDLCQVMEERDEAEEALNQAYYLITGRSPEWSDVFGHAEALEEIDEAQTALRKAAKVGITTAPRTEPGFIECCSGCGVPRFYTNGDKGSNGGCDGALEKERTLGEFKCPIKSSAHPVTTGPDAGAGKLADPNMVELAKYVLKNWPGDYASAKNMLASEVLRLHAAPGAGWRDISSAPKTGDDLLEKCVLGYCKDDHPNDRYKVIWWEPKIKGGVWWSDQDLECTPIYWQTLPEPPAPASEGAA